MKPHRTSILRAPLLALALLVPPGASASAQYLGYGGGYGYGGPGYGGYGYAGYGYGGFGGGGYGYGGFGGGGLGGYPALGYSGVYGYGAYSNAFGLGGVGYPGISALNPYFSFGLSPLAVENAAFERRALGRGLPATRPASARREPASPTAAGPVGTGTFSPPQ